MNTNTPELAEGSTATPKDRGNLTAGGVMAAVGIAAAASVIAPQIARAVTPALTFDDIPGTGDVKVLNYALALEDLEADLYVQAFMRLTDGGTNALGTKIKGLGLDTDQPDVAYVNEFTKVEEQHRDFLRASLGTAAISPFKYDFKMETLHREQVLNLVYTAEKTGVSAYLGAFPFFATRTYVKTASAIQGTEARHTAIIAAVINQLYNEGLPTAPLASPLTPDSNGGKDSPLTPDQVLAAVSGFIVT